MPGFHGTCWWMRCAYPPYDRERRRAWIKAGIYCARRAGKRSASTSSSALEGHFASGRCSGPATVSLRWMPGFCGTCWWMRCAYPPYDRERRRAWIKAGIYCARRAGKRSASTSSSALEGHFASGRCSGPATVSLRWMPGFCGTCWWMRCAYPPYDRERRRAPIEADIRCARRVDKRSASTSSSGSPGASLPADARAGYGEASLGAGLPPDVLVDALPLSTLQPRETPCVDQSRNLLYAQHGSKPKPAVRIG